MKFLKQDNSFYVALILILSVAPIFFIVGENTPDTEEGKKKRKTFFNLIHNAIVFFTFIPLITNNRTILKAHFAITSATLFNWLVYENKCILTKIIDKYDGERTERDVKHGHFQDLLIKKGIYIPYGLYKILEYISMIGTFLLGTYKLGLNFQTFITYIFIMMFSFLFTMFLGKKYLGINGTEDFDDGEFSFKMFRK